jgi:dethiobiotin synthetase/adenosylmethionine--8-amino-7-oxononanoate aminotransferase
MVIDSAKGDYFDAFYKKPEATENKSEEKSLLNPLFDGSASWFT